MAGLDEDRYQPFSDGIWPNSGEAAAYSRIASIPRSSRVAVQYGADSTRQDA